VRLQMEPSTEEGKRLVEVAEAHASDFATRADQHDRENSFPQENFKAMYESGYMAGTVPQELGGMGVTSSYDSAVGTNRIARGCGATGLASNMARGAILGLANRWRMLKQQGDPAAAAIEETLRGVVSGDVGFCGANSEPGTTPLFIQTVATKTENGWLLNGRKVFATASPAATSIGMLVRYEDPEKGSRLMMTRVPRGVPGMTINNDWDAMGMRGTGSPSIVLENCPVPAPLVVDVGPHGVWSLEGPLLLFLGEFGAIGQAAAFLGVAEAAQDYVIKQAKTRRTRPGGKLVAEKAGAQQLVAQNEIELSAAASFLQTAGMRVEQNYTSVLRSGELAAMHEQIKLAQEARFFVTQTAVRVVDRAVSISGGSGFMSASPLSRMYRDVRAGPVMPMSPLDAYEYIGKVTLGLEPDIW